MSEATLPAATPGNDLPSTSGTNDGVHGHQPSDAKYVGIAIFLAVITAIEVGLYYTDFSSTITNSVLLILAGIKFVTVVMYFMHLKFDNKVLSRLFAAGFILATAIYIPMLGMFGVLSGPLVVGAFALLLVFMVSSAFANLLLRRS